MAIILYIVRRAASHTRNKRRDARRVADRRFFTSEGRARKDDASIIGRARVCVCVGIYTGYAEKCGMVIIAVIVF